MLSTRTSQVQRAEVVAVERHRLRCRRADGSDCQAIPALAMCYQPNVGDEVVLLAGDDEHFVVGVTKATAPTGLRVAGDLDLQADGRIRLQAGEGIELRSPEIAIEALRRLQLTARSCVQRLGSLFAWVADTCQFRSKRLRLQAEQTAHLTAERLVERARRDVKIDGDRIRLG